MGQRQAKNTPRPARGAGTETAGVRRRRAEPPSLAEIPHAELTPRVESAVMRLMRELDHLKDQLGAAKVRVTELETMADEDPLVPVLNRRGFMRELGRALAYRQRYGGPVSLLFLDLDGFKAVNDVNGHAAGDAVLRHVARLLLDNVRKSDLVGRLGGDEFAVVLHHADAAAAGRKGDHLMDIIAASPTLHAGAAIAVVASGGVAELGDGDTVAAALARADSAMYACKAGRGRRP